jgi:hypothetical protein
MTYAELEQSAVRGKIKARRDQVGEVPPGGLEVVDLSRLSAFVWYAQ